MTQLNPVVQKLAEQAKGFVDLNQHVGSDNGCMIYTYEGLNQFAELIVRECLEQIDKIRDGCEADKEYQQALGADWAGLAVARHFGVK